MDCRRAQHIAKAVKTNLELEQNWSQLRFHRVCPLDSTQPLPRPLLSGLPQKRLYIHPDDQIDMIKHEQTPGSPARLKPEIEWILPIHLSERASVATFANLFDSLPDPPIQGRPKRMLIATVHDDSTVVYYIIHDGLVKPRQN